MGLSLQQIPSPEITLVLPPRTAVSTSVVLTVQAIASMHIASVVKSHHPTRTFMRTVRKLPPVTSFGGTRPVQTATISDLSPQPRINWAQVQNNKQTSDGPSVKGRLRLELSVPPSARLPPLSHPGTRFTYLNVKAHSQKVHLGSFNGASAAGELHSHKQSSTSLSPTQTKISGAHRVTSITRAAKVVKLTRTSECRANSLSACDSVTAGRYWAYDQYCTTSH